MPLVQALDYVEELPRLEQPRFVVTCNFETFRVYDRDAWAKSQLIDHPFEFTLAELVDHPEYLSFITDPANSRLEKEKEVSIHAGELIGKLYDRMRQGYMDSLYKIVRVHEVENEQTYNDFIYADVG
jgi:type II restriction enzyme methylase subunits-like protein